MKTILSGKHSLEYKVWHMLNCLSLSRGQTCTLNTAAVQQSNRELSAGWMMCCWNVEWVTVWHGVILRDSSRPSIITACFPLQINNDTACIFNKRSVMIMILILPCFLRPSDTSDLLTTNSTKPAQLPSQHERASSLLLACSIYIIIKTHFTIKSNINEKKIHIFNKSLSLLLAI